MASFSRLLMWGLLASGALPFQLASQERGPDRARAAAAGGRAKASANSLKANPLKDAEAALESARSALHELTKTRTTGVAVDALRSAVVDLTAACAALRGPGKKIAGARSTAPEPAAEKREARLSTAELAARRKPVDPNKVRLALDQGLRWLQTHQDPDGRWDSDNFFKHDPGNARSSGPGNPVHDVGVTGLAMMALVADGNTTKKGVYKDAVRRAASWLREQQGANGLLGTAASHDFIYDHAIAAAALCELVRVEKESESRKSAQLAIDYLESHRNPYACWRYQPRDNDNDASVTSWCVKAYVAGEQAGLKVNQQALEAAWSWFEALTDPATGRIGYTKRGESSSRKPGDHGVRFPVAKGEAMTAAGLATRLSIPTRRRKPVKSKLSVRRLLANLPQPNDDGARDHYYWYYGTQAMAAVGGESWLLWSRAAAETLLARQQKAGGAAGSWDSASVWGEDGGRVYTTSLAVLALQSIWRAAQ